MNKQKGNMYGFVNYTWNAIKGKCPHGCSYCYMKPFWRGEIHLDEKELKQDLGKSNFIFVGSSTDMFADEVNEKWIEETLDHCTKFDNKYLFQTKNPKRFNDFWGWYPDNVVFGTTLETNRDIKDINCPQPKERAEEIRKIKGFPRMITIEPIMDFDLEPFVKMIQHIQPDFVNIGADSKGHKLDEPNNENIGHLISELKMFTKVNLKDNLKRIYS